MSKSTLTIARQALQCLYIAVDESVAKDVNDKVEAAFTSLLMSIAASDERCIWKAGDNDDCDVYYTTCGHAFVMMGDYALSEQPEFKYCCYCGKLLQAVEGES